MNAALRFFFAMALGLAISMPAVWAQGLLQKAQQAAQVQAPQMGLVRAGELKAALIAEKTAISPGAVLTLGLRLVHDPHWHTYWRNPGDSGLATTLEWVLPDGWRAGEIQWPAPQRIAVGPLANYGFEGDLLLPIELSAPKNLAPGTQVTFAVKASWLVCKDVCIPGEAYLGLVLPVVAQPAEAGPSADAPRFAQARLTLAVADTERTPQAYLKEKSLVLAWPSSLEREPRGYFFPYSEGLIAPSAAQSLSKTKDGWMLEIPLGESSRSAIEAARKAQRIDGIWVAPGQRAREWRAPLRAEALVPVALALVDAGQTAQQQTPARPAPADALGLLLAVVGALIGGLILNLMPCVFPVIGLKVLSFAQTAHSRTESVRHAFIFSLGVVASFVALAGMLVALRAAGEAVGWGFQLQHPMVVLLLALLFVAIAINLFGVFEVGLLATQLGNLEVTPQRSAGWSAFSSGVLAVVVASPCTAPFMGGAIGFAATAGVGPTLVVFSALGVGMAIPYVLLSIWPGLLQKLPKPGPWMIRFKQAMAFPMLAAAAWLFWVLASLQGAEVILVSLSAAILFALVLWVYGTYIQRRTAGKGSWLVVVLATILMIWAIADATGPRSGVGAGLNPLVSPAGVVASTGSGSQATPGTAVSGQIQWRAWAPGLAEQLQAQGQTVFVDFTASWCISCQANKIRVLQSDAIARAFAEQGVVALRADWTKKDSLIANELARHGRNGVPLYLVYDKTGGSPKILSEWLTEREVISAIR